MNRIYFFANFGDWNKIPYGGGEVGNRRTLSFLRKGNFNVVTIPKYTRVKNHSAVNLVRLGCKIIGNILKYFFILAFGTRRHSIVHIAGFYGPMIYFEYVLIALAKLFGYKVTYEMRGGGADTYFKEGSDVYKNCFRKSLLKCDVVFTQGLENVPLIKGINPTVDIFYYPNCVTQDFYPAQYPEKPKDRINFFYFGRISQTKNVGVVIDAFIALKSNFDNIYLDIVGNCSDNNYMESIQCKIAQNHLEEYIKIHPACNHEKLREHLRDKHFYIFPTTEPHEGHSNALTEAMAWGLIPVATSQGFNRSVIGDDRLIVHELSGKNFAKIVADIINDKKTEDYSMTMYKRVMDNYTDHIVCERLLKEYETLFERFA